MLSHSTTNFATLVRKVATVVVVVAEVAFGNAPWRVGTLATTTAALDVRWKTATFRHLLRRETTTPDNNTGNRTLWDQHERLLPKQHFTLFTFFVSAPKWPILCWVGRYTLLTYLHLFHYWYRLW